MRLRRPAAPSLAALPALALAAAAGAVVISTGDGSGNTAPPADDFGLQRVGRTVPNSLSGVYLGGRWVLTANHVGERDIVFQDSTHPAVSGSKVRLANPGPDLPDLMLYRLQSGPPLPRLRLSSATPGVGEALHCAGHGWNREAGETQWNATWEEVPPGLPPVRYTGYKRGAGKILRWGRNQVSERGVTVLDTESIVTVFDRNGVADEDSAVSGDSGGGCFAKRAGKWELVGLLFARTSFGDGPGPLADQPANTAVFGNESVAADVFFYRDQIESITAPAVPALGAPWALLLAAGLAGAPRAAALRR